MKIVNVFLLLSCIGFCACEKVINVDLNDANKQIVIESIIEAGTHNFEVKITRTTSYFNPQEPERVTNATVTLYDNNVSHNVPHLSEGVYLLSEFTAKAGHNYRLMVSYDGKVYQATAVMPTKIPIAQLKSEQGKVTLVFNDPVASTDYYRVRYRVMGIQDIGGAVNSDQYVSDLTQNGETIEFTVLGDDESGPFGEVDTSGFSGTDTVHVELSTINKAGYVYFDELDNTLSGGGFGESTPANPTNNWDEGALGHFSATNSDFGKTVRK